MTQPSNASIPLIVFNDEDRFTRFGQDFTFVSEGPGGFVLQNLANGIQVALAPDQMAKMFAGRSRPAAARTTGRLGAGHSATHAADDC